MARIPQETIDEIRNRADIVDVIGSYVPLKQRGSEYWACCPFHKEKTPSFKVSAERQAYYCFGCKKSGSVFHFVQDMENTDFVGALHVLAQRTGVRIPESDGGGEEGTAARKQRADARQRGYDLLARIAGWYSSVLLRPEGEPARAYLTGRGLDSATITRFGLGYAPDSWDAALTWARGEGFDPELLEKTGMIIRREEPRPGVYDRFRKRLMFPIRDELGRVVGFSGRILEKDAKSAKYVNTPETEFFHKGRLLYGLDFARQSFRDTGHALICEGQLDVIACHRAGLTHAVCAQGTAFTDNHARLLKRSTEAVVLAFDADEAGEKAAVRTIEICHEVGLSVRVVSLPQGEDPDSLFKRGGAEGLAEVMAGGVEAVPFVLSLARRGKDLGIPEIKDAVAREVLDVIRTVSSPVARAGHTQWLAQSLGLPEAAVFDLLNRMIRQSRRPGPSPAAVADGQAPGAEARRRPAGLPVFTMPTLQSQSFCDLLHLAVAFEDIALALTDPELLPPSMVPDTPVGQALNLVLAHTQQGEWAMGIEELRQDMELPADPDVARVLHDPKFMHLEDSDSPESLGPQVSDRRQKAMNDCLNQLRLAMLEERIRELQSALSATAGDPERQREILIESTELNRRRLALRQAIRQFADTR